MKNKSDLELIIQWQQENNKTQIEAYLYKKYTPLCKSIAKKYEKISSFEDNMQECYLIMLKALEYVDESKIHNPENYSFGVTFRYHLTAYFNVQLFESNQRKNESATVSIYKEDNSIYEKAIESDEKEIIFEITLNNFKKLLDAKEIKVFNFLKDGQSKKEIAQKMNIKSIHYMIDKIKTKYIHFMNENGYAI